MNIFATNDTRKPSRIGSLAIISGAMLSAVAAIGPAFSADLPEEYPPYRPYHRSYNCYSCAPVAEERPIVESAPVERHWVQRDYIERRYVYSSYPDRYRYSHYCNGPCTEPYRDCPAPCTESYPSYEPAPYRRPWRRLSYVGAHYPPAPAAYEYESGPRAPYRYAASSHNPYGYYRPSYETEYNPAYEYKPVYEHEPRPPAPVPGGYYGPGYFK